MDVDMGYEDPDSAVEQAYPRPRRSDRRMSQDEERQRRASIKAILADQSITPHERRRSIQHLMDGRRSSIGTASVDSTICTSGDNPYGFGDANPYGYNSTIPSKLNLSIEFATEGATCVPCSNEATKRAEQTRPNCPHYDRKCTMIAPCCGASFGCRICHDESPILPPLLIQKRADQLRYPRSSSMPMNPAAQTPEDTHHTIDRFAVKEIICRECYTKQSSKT